VLFERRALLTTVMAPDVRYLLRNILNGLKALLTMLRRRKVPEPSGEIMGRVFVDGMRCWTCYEQAEGPPDKDLMENFASMFIELEPQTFHEVFTTHMPFLFDLMLTNPVLLGIPQTLLSNEGVSRRYVGIMLRFLVDRLDELGDADKKHASVTLRLFKMSFMAVTIFPEENEAVLQPHLSHLIMQSMKLASKASEPANYFLLLRALFRSIGGGRFELLYKDVLPLLPVLLENLNNLLNAAEPSRRELFVDLCLTVPVRLSVLLPYLGYLMRPLVLALQSSTELVSQGLRTLELCIDNLTQEFLDPIMAPYATDIMTALLKHLQPLPHNHQHSHTTMRILGKMGGRNRRLLQQPPKLTYHDHPQATFTVHFEGKAQSLVLAPVIDLALSGIRRGDLFRRKHSFELLRHAAALFLDGTLGNAGGEREQAFERVVKGLFDATHSEEGGAGLEGATAYLLGLSRHIFTLETRREVGTTRQPGPLMTYFMQGIAYALAANDNEAADAAAIVELELRIIGEAREVCVEASRPEQWITLMHSLASKHCTLCYDQLWQRKTGGWLAIDMMVRRANLGVPWLREHQLEIMRALLYMLKDMPTDPPGNVEAVSDTILFVLRTVHTATPAPAAESTPSANGAASEAAAKPSETENKADSSASAPAAVPKPSEPPSSAATPAPGRPDGKTDEEQMQERQFNYLVGVLVLELSSSNAKVRSVARASFELLAELRGTSVTTILTPIKDRLLQPIFSKPLRALPFGMQIGHIDAVTFCLQLTPPLPEPNEELFRVLTEALALADADDLALIGRTSQYKNMLAVTNLRVVALRLLASAMACQDFLGAKHAQLRIRIIAVYFKSLYSRSQEVVDEAYKSLKETLASQPKLPKDVLQSGLRPILMTLADAGRLTVAGLDGLARLLELLTSYFKVEIGSKLLSHMEAIADREVLERAGEGALQGPSYADAHHLLQPRPARSSDAIETLAAVVRVFHLLPPTASMFMPQLVKQVCDIETVLRRSGPTPFTKPLAQYFDKYPREAVELFFGRLEDARYVRCFKLTLACDDAPRLRKQVEEDKSTRLLPLLTGDVDPRKTLAALQVVRELEARQPGWIVDNVDIIDALLVYWRSPGFVQRRASEKGTREQRVSVQIVEVFTAYLSRRHHTDIYFAFADLASFPGPLDLTGTVRFVYQRLAIDGALADRRAVLMRCIDVFERKDVTQAYKAECFRLLANPILIAAPRPVAPAEAESKASASASASDAKGAAAKADEPAQAKDGEAAAATPAEPLFHVDLLNTVVQRVWRVFQTKVGAQVCSEDVLRLEVIQFSTMVLEHCEQLMSSVQGAARKDAIKFGWANLATEDITVKTTSYIFIARFLASFDAPFKIVAKVFMGLLRLHQSESRGLVRKALDILVPALPKRVPAAEPGQPSQWAKWTKRQLTEEGQNVAQIGLIFGLLVRHADLFYADRELFMGHIASNLSKLGLSSSSSVESRSLCVELVDVVARWERRRAEAVAQTESKTEGADTAGDAAATTTRKRSGTASGSLAEAAEPQKRARIDDAGSAVVRSTSPVSALPSRSDAAEHQYTPPPPVRDALLGFLLRFVSLSAEPISLRGTTAKAFNTLRDLLAAPGWSNVPIRLAVFQKPLTSLEVQDSTLVVLTNSLQALRAVIKDKSEAWLLLHVAQLHRLLERCASAEQPVILENCRDTLERIFAVLPEPAPGEEDAEGDDEDDAMADAAPAPAAPKQEAEPQQPEESAAAFRTFADRIITEGLRSNGAGLYGAFVMLASWAKARPEKVRWTHASLMSGLS
jgi:transformation/transcription domain-associated protein